MADSIVSFTVQRSTDNGQSWTTITNPPLDGSARDYTDQTPPANASYRVRGLTALGFEITYNDVTPPQPPPPPPDNTGTWVWQVPIKGNNVTDLVDIGGVTSDSANNYIVVGSFSGTVDFGNGFVKTSAGGWDVFVVKYNINGTVQWVNQYGDNFDQFGSCVAVDSANNIFVGGYFAGSVNVQGTVLNEVQVPAFFYSSFDILLIKLNPSGDKIWAKAFGGGGVETCTGIAVDSADNVIFTGNYTIPAPATIPSQTQLDFGGGGLTNQCPQDMYVTKLRGADGEWVPGLSFAIHHGTNDGTFSNTANSTGIAVDSAGDVVVCGYITGGTIDLGAGGTQAAHGGSDFYVAKYLGTTGAGVWARVIGGTGSDIAKGIAVNPTNDAIVTGGFIGTVDFGSGFIIATPQAATGVFVAKFIANTGITDWARGFGGNFNGEDIGYAIDVDATNHMVLSGTVRSSFIDFGGGPRFSVDGTLNIFIVKLANNGTFVPGECWDKRINTGGTLNYGKSIRADSENKVVLAGFFAGTINFGGPSISGTSDHTGFLVKFTN